MIPKVIQHSPLNQKTLHHVSYPIALSFSKQGRYMGGKTLKAGLKHRPGASKGDDSVAGDCRNEVSKSCRQTFTGKLYRNQLWDGSQVLQCSTVPWQPLPDSHHRKKSLLFWLSMPWCSSSCLAFSLERCGAPTFTEVLCFSDDSQHGTLHQGTLIFLLSPSPLWYSSWDGPTGSSFGLPPPAMCVSYPCCFPTPSNPMYQLFGGVPPLQWVQSHIMMPTQKFFQACISDGWV